MSVLINSFLLVFIGEVGDKTQLLAMAMASKYKARQVITGVLVATLLNQALAVLIGSCLGSILPMNLIAIAAGISFLLFGLWTIRGDGGDDKDKASRFGPILTVAMAFFMAEMGDKTQLMTVALSAEYRQPILILIGSSLGMVAANSIGIFFSSWICRYLSQAYIKWIAGLIFICFGSITLYQNVPAWITQPLYIAAYLLALGTLIFLVGVKFSHRPPEVCE